MYDVMHSKAPRNFICFVCLHLKLGERVHIKLEVLMQIPRCAKSATVIKFNFREDEMRAEGRLCVRWSVVHSI